MEIEVLGDDGLERAERFLDYFARRQEVIAANVANLSTPGYKTVDLRFEDVLESELEGFKVIKTSPRHFEIEGPEPSWRLAKVSGLDERADGNNVSFDRELLAMTLNRLRFQMGLQWASSRIRTLRAAMIDRGGL